MRNQNISIERFDEINEIWGIHQPPLIFATHKQYPRILRVTNREVQKNQEGLFGRIKHLRWHCNGVFAIDPEECISLFCVETAKSGGLTHFADGVHVLEMLTKKEREELESVSIFLTNDLSKTYLKQIPYNYLPHEQKDLDRMKVLSSRNPDTNELTQKLSSSSNKKIIEKKLIVKHPLSGKTGLYFPYFYICKMHSDLIPPFQLKQYFQKLIECYTGSKGKIYSHQWTLGDIVLSDQVHSLHQRDPFEGFRELYRTAFWYHNPNKKSGV